MLKRVTGVFIHLTIRLGRMHITYLLCMRVHICSQTLESLFAALHQSSIEFCLAQMVFETFVRWFSLFGFGRLAHLQGIAEIVMRAFLYTHGTYAYTTFFMPSASWLCSRIANRDMKIPPWSSANTTV